MIDKRPHYIVCNADHSAPRNGPGCICSRLDQEEIERLRALLVKACVEVADGLYFEERFCPYTSDHEACIKYVADEYGIRLRWNGETFEEDTGK